MLDKQLLGRIGALMCILAIFLPANVDGHCAGFFKFDWEKPYFTRFTCASSQEGNIFSCWGDRTDWDSAGTQRLLSVFITLGVLAIAISVLTELYLILWGLVPVMIACTIALQSKSSYFAYTVWPAWIAFMLGYILLMITVCTRDKSCIGIGRGID